MLKLSNSSIVLMASFAVSRCYPRYPRGGVVTAPALCAPNRPTNGGPRGRFIELIHRRHERHSFINASGEVVRLGFCRALVRRARGQSSQ
jgi:hypothetical protein